MENKELELENLNKDKSYEYGIIFIKPTDFNYETPMMPITMMRNALGKKEGGSGVPLDHETYLKSVEFWSQNISLRWMILTNYDNN